MILDSAKILLIDDEPDILDLISFNLTSEGYSVFTATNGAEGLLEARRVIPDLILSDVMMPKMDGIELCEHIRNDPKINRAMVVFLTARGEDYSHMAAFDAGADDYITKPIKPKLLIRKIKSLLRRSKYSYDGELSEDIKKDDVVIKVGDLTVDKMSYIATKGSKKIVLPRKEFELLFLLASQPEKVFRREKILETVWGANVVVGGRTIDVHIRKLREKIGSNHIITVKGVGYKYNP